MPKAKIDSIVTALAFDRASRLVPIAFDNASRREWQHVVSWLDGAGLSLYFLKTLAERRATDAVPTHVLLQLQERQYKNEQRTARMRRQFEILNNAFCKEGVRYAVLKGFSLIPEYCPDASLRGFSDLDYLIAKSSRSEAQKILTAQGYSLKAHRGEELIFWVPSDGPGSELEQYDPCAPFTIELHLKTWDHGLNEVPVAARKLAFDRMVFRQGDGVRFYGLPHEEMFVGQVMHAFRHWVLGSTRPSWVFEIGYFLKHRRNDDPIWEAVEEMMASDPSLAEVISLISRLVALVFGEVHPKANAWTDRLNPTIRKWLDNYGRDSVLGGSPGYDSVLFPRSKLMVFMRDQYRGDFQAALGLQRRQLVPVYGVRHLADTHGKVYRLTFKRKIKKLGWIASRSMHHAGASLRYFWELPRWRRICKSLGSEQDAKAIKAVSSL